MKTLGDILKEELEVYKAEYKLVKEKIEAITKDDIKTLEDITKKEEQIIIKISELEGKRVSLLSDKNYESLSEFIISLEEGSEKEKLKLLKKEFVDIIEKIKYENSTAEQLISISNGVINSIIKLATGNKEYGYKKDRQKKEVTQNNLLNKKI